MEYANLTWVVVLALALGVIPATWEAINNHRKSEDNETDWRDEL